MDLITIKSFLTPDEALLMQSLLRSEGIESFLRDENTARTAPYLQNAIGGVKLAVAEADVNSAISVLTQAGYFEEEEKKKTNECWKALLAIVVIAGLLALSRSC